MFSVNLVSTLIYNLMDTCLYTVVTVFYFSGNFTTLGMFCTALRCGKNIDGFVIL